jgi:hypothetical protein
MRRRLSSRATEGRGEVTEGIEMRTQASLRRAATCHPECTREGSGRVSRCRDKCRSSFTLMLVVLLVLFFLPACIEIYAHRNLTVFTHSITAGATDVL